MAVRFYIVPSTGDGSTIANARKPSYIGSLNPTPKWSAISFGLENVMLLAADVTPAQHTSLAANNPITVVPANLTSTVGANLTTTQNQLSSWGIPNQWVTSNMTWGAVLRGVATIMQFAQRFSNRSGSKLLPPGVTFNTTMAELTQAQRNALQNAVDSFGWNSNGITGTTTIGEFLRLMSLQLTSNIKMLTENL